MGLYLWHYQQTLMHQLHNVMLSIWHVCVYVSLAMSTPELCHRFIQSSANHWGWLASFAWVCSSMAPIAQIIQWYTWGWMVGGNPLGPLMITPIFSDWIQDFPDWIFNPKGEGRRPIILAKFSQKNTWKWKASTDRVKPLLSTFLGLADVMCCILQHVDENVKSVLRQSQDTGILSAHSIQRMYFVSSLGNVSCSIGPCCFIPHINFSMFNFSILLDSQALPTQFFFSSKKRQTIVLIRFLVFQLSHIWSCFLFDSVKISYDE